MKKSSFGFGTSSNSYGQFWYGGNNFPGFLFKKNNGVGARKSTQFTPGGTIICNQPNEFWNKYKPGTGGVGASTVSNRRAKNRHATVCTNQKCFPCYMTLGQYSNYTHNPNGFYNCINNKIVNPIPRLIPRPTPYNPYQADAYFATFRGSNPDLYGRTNFLGPITTPTLKYSYNVSNNLNDMLTGSCVIDKNGNIYTLTTNKSLLVSFTSNLILIWIFDPQILNLTYSSSLFTPVISSDGTIYFATNVQDNNQNNSYSKLFAINPNGTKKWEVTLQDSVNNSDTYMILLSKEEDIFVVTYNNINIYSTINIITKFGQIKNQINFNNIYLLGWNMNLSMNSDELYITGVKNGNNNLYIINYKNNTNNEINLLNNSSSLYSIPLKINEYIYICSDIGISKINSITNTIVNQNTTEIIIASSPCVDNEEKFYVGEGSPLNSFIKFDKFLNTLWNYQFDSNSIYFVGSPLISQNEYIYLIDNNNNNPLLTCLDKSGNPLWNVNINNNNSGGFPVVCNPCIGKNNLIYVIGGNEIQAFGE
jgi:hypothetical protein